MSSSNDLVSVIVPVHNGAETVADALRSVLDQSHPRLEVIVVDDASTDRSWEVINSLGDPRVKPFRQERNLGEGLTRNAAIARAAGEWVAMLDADDAWHRDRLQTLLRLAPPGDDCILADNIMHCYSVGPRLQPWKPQWGRGDLPFDSGSALLELADYLALRALLVKPVIRRHVLSRRNILHSSRVFSADTEFLVRVLKTGLRLRIAEQPLYFYRRTPKSMSDNPRRAAIMRDMFGALIEELDFTECEAALVRQRIDRLRREERYNVFLGKVKGGAWNGALADAIRETWLPAEFLRRLPDSVAYRLHVWRHGGRAR